MGSRVSPSLRIVFAGTPAAAVPALDALLASPHEVVAVVTRPDARAGRGRQLVRSAVGVRADQAGVEVLTPVRPSDPAFLARLSALAPQCCPVVAYGGLIPVAALDIPTYGWVNLHFSILPAWRGAAPVQHALLHGDEVTGATTFRLETGLDTGPVFGVVTETIQPTDTAGELLARLAHSGAQLLVATLDGIAAGELVAQPQSVDGVSLAPKVAPAQAQIDWAAPALHIDRLIRAFSPEPGAWSRFRGNRVGLGPVQALTDERALKPGQLLIDRQGVRVGTGSYPVQLTEVQPAGKHAMAAADWARGLRLTDHACFDFYPDSESSQ